MIMSEEKITILSKRTFEIKSFSHVFIADPWHLELLEQEENSAKQESLKRLMIDFCITKEKHIAKLVLRKVLLVTEEGEYILWEIIFCSEKKGQQSVSYTDTAFKGNYYPELVDQKGDLGCDTARYCISIDGREEEVYTGSDGYWGDFYTYKNNSFACVTLSFDGNIVDEADLLQLIHSLFTVTQEIL